MTAFEKAWMSVKKSIETATRSAELWAHNTEEIYFKVINAIQSSVNMGETREETKALLATSILPTAMMPIEGLHEELSRPDYDGTTDSWNDIDWEEVAEGFMDYYDEYQQAGG